MVSWLSGSVEKFEHNTTKKRNIINFDEQGVRIGCMKRGNFGAHRHFRILCLSPENRHSLTIFEKINAAGECPPLPMLIIQGQEFIESWF